MSRPMTIPLIVKELWDRNPEATRQQIIDEVHRYHPNVRPPRDSEINILRVRYNHGLLMCQQGKRPPHQVEK